MDGTRDRPPGRTAQITGRKDGIRAGAVSGPWRSGPVDEAAPVRKPQPLRAPAQPAPVRAAPHEPAAQRLPQPDPPPSPAATRPAIAPRLSRQNVRAIAWVGFGLLVAGGAVVAAFLLRPSGTPPPAPAAAVEPAPAPPAEAAPPAPAAATAPAGPAAGSLAQVSVVRLRVGPGFPAERQAAILAALDGAGIKDVKVESLPFEVATSRVGYYRPDDVAAADALARLVTPVVGTGDGEVGVRDYGKLLDDAEPGRLDLWVGD